MHLHIVTLNIPYPPDYGGMIDSYYRIMALHEQGVMIHLHCFEYGRSHPPELEKLCETVTYYRRRSWVFRLFSYIPYTVVSRNSRKLLKNLEKDDFPVLFDGLHTAYYLTHPALNGRIKLVRMHNIEQNYYRSLALSELNLLRKIYYKVESVKLARFEKAIAMANYVLPISEGDHKYFSKKYHNSVLIPPFHQFSEIISQPGTGDYVLYHGDLSVNENSAIADFLILNVFSKTTYRCILAGKNVPGKIIRHASRFKNIEIVSDPDNEAMLHLVENAQVNILPALSGNGFKLKILMALFAGRHCLVNPTASSAISDGNLFSVADSSEEFIDKIHFLVKIPFTDEMINDRRNALSGYFSNSSNARKLKELIRQ